MLGVRGRGHLLLPLRGHGVPLLQDLLQVEYHVYEEGDHVLQEDLLDAVEEEDEEIILLLSPWWKLPSLCDDKKEM